MPKSVKKVRVGQEWHRVKVGTKFRIGTRKTGVSAHLMSTEELLKVLLNDDKSKWHNSANAVLNLRTI